MSVEERRRVSQKVQAVLGAGVEITIDCVDTITPAASGKYRYVISNVAEQWIAGLRDNKAKSMAQRAGRRNRCKGQRDHGLHWTTKSREQEAAGRGRRAKSMGQRAKSVGQTASSPSPVIGPRSAA